MMKLNRRNPVSKNRLTGALACALVLGSAHAHAITNASATDAVPVLGRIGGSFNGVLIAPNWVLTAAHVATGKVAFASASGSAQIDSAYLAPGFGMASDNTPYDDLALLHLSGDGIRGADLPRLNGQGLTEAQVITYPVPRATMIGVLNSSQRQRATADLLGMQDTHTPLAGGSSHTVNWVLVDGATGSHLEGGDSGSALFWGDGTQGPLIGIASGAAPDGSMSAFVQVAAYRSWIDGTMSGSGQQALWSTAPVPEPSTYAMLLCGLGMLAFAARRGSE